MRYEVIRAQNEGLEYQSYQSKDICRDINILDQFEEAYIEFAKGLGTEVLKAYNRKKIESYIESNCFMLTTVSYDKLTVYHAYVYDNEETVLIYSVSDFREEGMDKNLAGRANKWLHYKDMIFLKNLGLAPYDWGNISNKENMNGIDNFKISFGGNICEKYNILYGNNLWGKIFVWSYKKYRRIKK